VLPAVVVDRLPPEPRVVEVGVGGRFDALRELAERRPQARLVAVDVDPAGLEGAPAGVETHVDDVHEPRASIYRGVDLVFARRPPAELQPAIARLARAHGADLALRALKDEWADLTGILGEPAIPPEAGAWRWWPADAD
jgi:uncharacterized UPF0146 family protein